MYRQHKHDVAVVLVANYPEITAIAAVLNVIIVFWVWKCQMGGNAVTLCVHFFVCCIQGNYRLRDAVHDTPQFYSHSDEHTPGRELKLPQNHPTQTTHIDTMSMSNNSESAVAVLVIILIILFALHSHALFSQTYLL